MSDLIFLTSDGSMRLFRMDWSCSTWFCHCAYYARQCSIILEPLLVLAFSVERLVAVIRPVQVCQLQFLPRDAL